MKIILIQTILIHQYGMSRIVNKNTKLMSYLIIYKYSIMESSKRIKISYIN